MDFIRNLKFDRKQILVVLILILLILAIPISVYLVQRQQILKSQANQSLLNAFEIKDKQGQIITCDPTTTPPTCETPTEDITITIKDLDLLRE